MHSQSYYQDPDHSKQRQSKTLSGFSNSTRTAFDSFDFSKINPALMR